MISGHFCLCSISFWSSVHRVRGFVLTAVDVHESVLVAMGSARYVVCYLIYVLELNICPSQTHRHIDLDSLCLADACFYSLIHAVLFRSLSCWLSDSGGLSGTVDVILFISLHACTFIPALNLSNASSGYV